MATWIAHLRVAENVMKKMHLDRGLFIIGNLAPDCNRANEDWSSFIPDAKLTHYRVNGNRSELELFLDEHYNLDDDLPRKSFILGYYAHLITDNMWGAMFRSWKDKHPDITDKLNSDKSFVWTIKKDWYGQDFKYLRENVNNVFVDEFLALEPVIDFLDFFPAEIMNEKLEYIKSFYSDKDKAINLSEFKYLTTDQMDMFVDECSAMVLDQLVKVI